MFTFFFAIGLILESCDERLLPRLAPFVSLAGMHGRRVYGVAPLAENGFLLYLFHFVLTTREVYIFS